MRWTKGLHFTPPGTGLLQREVCNFCETKKPFFSPVNRSLRGRKKGWDWEMFAVSFVFPWLFSISAEGWEWISNSAHGLFPWPALSWHRGCVDSNSSCIYISVAHPSCLKSKFGEPWRPPSVIQLIDTLRLHPEPKTTRTSPGSRHSVQWMLVVATQ